MTTENHKQRAVAIRSYTSAKGTRYCCGAVADLHSVDFATTLWPLYAAGSCLIVQYDSGPVDDSLANAWRVASDAEKDDVTAGQGWIMVSGRALHYVMVAGEFRLYYSTVYLFSHRVAGEPALPPSGARQSLQDSLPSVLVEYLDRAGASGYLADALVDGWVGCEFLFREDVVGPGTMRHIVHDARGRNAEGDHPAEERRGFCANILGWLRDVWGSWTGYS